MLQTDQKTQDLLRMADKLREQLGSDSVYVTEINEDGQLYLASSESSPAFPTGSTLDVDRSISRHVSSMNFPLVVDDTQSHPLLMGNPLTRADFIGAYAGFPVRDARRRVVAVVCATFNRLHRWTKSEQELIASAASDTAQILES